ncbi:MAG: chemotaxis protein [Magnetococcus sp. WYHC-3]
MSEDFMVEIDRRANLAFSNQMEMLTFYLTDDQQYGINVFKIIEAIETPKSITRIAKTHPSVVGAINFRDRLVTVIDLSVSLGLEPVDFAHTISYIIICEYSNSTQGFLISRPNKLITRSWNEVKRPSSHMQNSGYLTAITYDDEEERAIQILDVEKVLEEIVGSDSTVNEKYTSAMRRRLRQDRYVVAVDDSRSARSLLDNTLTQLGVRFKLFDDATKALSHLEHALEEGEISEVGLIISDIEMPDMDGFTFARTLKSHAQLSKIHLVLHSSMSNQANRIKAEAVGADDFIPKFQPDAIAEVVVRHMSA